MKQTQPKNLKRRGVGILDYLVIRQFADKNAEGRIYEVGELYEGSKAAKRISELTNPEKNKYGRVYLQKKPVEKTEEPKE